MHLILTLTPSLDLLATRVLPDGVPSRDLDIVCDDASLMPTAWNHPSNAVVACLDNTLSCYVVGSLALCEATLAMGCWCREITVHYVDAADVIGEPRLGKLSGNGMSAFRIQSYKAAKDGGYVIHYKKAEFLPQGEESYLNELRTILAKGNARPDRTGVGTVSLFARQLRFDLSDGTVPFLTTKALAWKAVLKELLWFIRGHTDSKELEAQGVKIWGGNTSRAFLDARGLTDYEEGDVGPMYGFAWRHFGAAYKGCKADYAGQGVDQLARLEAGLKADPTSRRHVMTTFDPSAVDQCVLYPCHGLVTQFYVEETQTGYAPQLSCHVYCRSQDMFLGQPFNIAGYAVLLALMAKRCGMKRGELVISTGDSHVYKNHLEAVEAQLKRPMLPFPLLEVSDTVVGKPWEAVDVQDFKVVGYLHGPAIRAPMAV